MLIRPPPRRGLFFPPGATPRINEAHPAAGLLQAAYLFGPRPMAIVPGFGGLSVLAGTPVPAIGRTGVYTYYDGSSGHQGLSAPSGALSVVIVGMRAITPGTAGADSLVMPAVSCNSSSAATKHGFEFGLGNDYLAPASPLAPYAFWYTTSAQYNGPSGMWVDGVKNTLGGFNNAAGSTVLTNGVFYAVGVTFPNMDAGDNPLTFGKFGTGSFTLTGGLQVAYVFSGVLPDGLMSELTLNPADLLEWPEDTWPTFAPSATLAPLAAEIAGAVPITAAIEAQTGGGFDTHDGYLRRSRRQRALDAAEKRRRDERVAEAVALRLAIEAAMGEAADVAEEAPAPAVEAVTVAVQQARRFVVPLAVGPDPAVLEAARAALVEVRTAIAAADRARMLAEDDEDVLMLLRAL